MAAAGPAAGADDTHPPSLKIYFHCGTSAGTHTEARRDARDLQHYLKKKKKGEMTKKPDNNHYAKLFWQRFTLTVAHCRLDQCVYSVQNWTDDMNLPKRVSKNSMRILSKIQPSILQFSLPDFPLGSPSPAQNPPRIP